MYDIFSNHKICKVRDLAEQSVGTTANIPAAGGIDLQEKSEFNLPERSIRALLLIQVSVVATGGELTITVQDLAGRSTTWDDDFAVLEKITEVGNYAVVLDHFNQKLRFSAAVATAAVTWGAQLITFEATRRPVKQTDYDTSLTVTYSSGR